ncbi:MAG: SRPBCC family protein [Anaerolineae bacterium]
MKLDGEHIFHGPRQAVWALIRDPEALAKALPGTESLTKLSENEYEGTMNVRIGPIAGTFSGRVVISDEVPPESCTLTAEGKGAQGFAKGVGRVVLTDQGDGTTLMKYEGDVQIGGKLASVGQRSLDTVSKSMIRQGLSALDQLLEARLAAQAVGEQEVEYTKPTEAEFAAAVARDVTRDVIRRTTHSHEGRLLLLIVPLVIVLFLLAIILVQCQG